jgi:hypothetical protein
MSQKRGKIKGPKLLFTLAFTITIVYETRSITVGPEVPV